MGSFDPAKCFNAERTIRLNTDMDIVDTFGTIRGSDQFDGSKVVDIFGNLGSVPAAGPWEIQVGSVETVGSHLSRNASAYVTPFSAYSSQGCTGYIDGVLSGTAAWTIQSSPQTINGVSYQGCGLLVATANNTLSTTTMQTGTKLQLGELTGTTGSIRDVSLATGAVLDIYGANTTRFNKVFIVTNNAGGTVNWKGPGICGQGILGNQNTFTNNGTVNIDDCEWALGVGLAGSGNINVLDGGTFFNNSQNVAAGNTFNIQGCGWCGTAYVDAIPLGAIHFQGATTFASNINLVAPACMKALYSTSTNISGLLTGNYPLELGNTVNQTGRHGSSFSFTNNANTYDSTITVTSTSLYNTGATALQKADIVLANNGMFQQDGGVVILGSLSSDSTTATVLANSSVTMLLNENGNTTYDGQFQNSTPGTPWNFRINGPDTNQIKLTGAGGVVNLSSDNGGKIIAQGGTYEFWASNNGGTISAGTSKNTIIKTLYLKADAFLDVYAANGGGTGKITSNAVAYLIAGWKVNIKDPLPAGIYDILVSPNPTGAYANLPTVAANASGLTASFEWVGNVLKMTLA